MIGAGGFAAGAVLTALVTAIALRSGWLGGPSPADAARAGHRLDAVVPRAGEAHEEVRAPEHARGRGVRFVGAHGVARGLPSRRRGAQGPSDVAGELRQEALRGLAVEELAERPGEVTHRREDRVALGAHGVGLRGVAEHLDGLLEAEASEANFMDED